MKARLFLPFFALNNFLGAHPLDKTWTNHKGEKIQAEVIEVKGDSVSFRMPNGKEISYPIANLSITDQERLKDLVIQKTPANDELRLNFDSAWPDRVTFEESADIEVVREDSTKNEFLYQSANFRYHCNVRLSKSVVKGFAVLFEATHKYVRALPLSLIGGVQEEGKYPIYLYETEEQYHEAGGPVGSAGVFMGGEGKILVPLTSVGVQKVGSGYMLDRDRSSKTLAHEIVHQLTPDVYYEKGAMGWFSEGIADYVAVTPYRSGSYNVKTNFDAIVEYVTAYGKKNSGGRALGTEIKLGSLKEFMLIPYNQFTANGSLNYGSALLITNYFFHLDREGDAARIKKFLKALKAGKAGDEALDVLLDGQTWAELEAEIQKAYSRKGVDFIF